MKQNITLSIDKKLIQKVKVLAAHKQTSISGLLSAELLKTVEKAEKYEWAKRKAMGHLEKGFHLGGTAVSSREALHER